MTRLRNKNKPQKDEEGVNKPKTGMTIPAPKPKKVDFVDSFLMNNWKQQSLVKKGDNQAPLTSFVLMLQILASVGFGTFAASSGGSNPEYLVPAIATAGYTVASINNAFDKNLHGLVAFLDSPFMISVIMVILVNAFVGGPSSIISWLSYAMCCLPFLIDWILSMRSTFVTYGTEQREPGCTVTEIQPENEENFINAGNQSDSNANRYMTDPSELLVPNVIASVEPLNNLVANNWRENAVDSRNSTVKQLAAFALIAGYFYLGGVGVESGSYTTVGAVSLAYATSSLFGYFGMATAPIVKLMRVNMISVVCAVMGMMSLMGGMDMALAMLTLMHIFDAYQGAINENGERTPDISDFERIRGENELEQRNDGPILSFFTESWKIGSFSKKNFETCQIVQIVMFGLQMYTALIAGINGGPPVLIACILAMILAGSYSFFSPMRITAVDAVQSNGSQVALLGASLHHIVTATPGVPFYILFCLMSADLMMSCSTFFNEHQRSMGQAAAHQLGMSQKDGSGGRYSSPDRRGRGGDNDEDFGRQL